MKMNVVISTDGACSGNPGPGGYAAILRCSEHTKEVAGFENRTTNNRMEMRACIEAMSCLKKPCTITVRTDSQVLINALVNLDAGPATGWKTKTGAKRANLDLLQTLYKLKHEGNHDIYYQYIAGHSGDPDNERCDSLAKQQIKAHTICLTGKE